jgi:hypothetical protein
MDHPTPFVIDQPQWTSDEVHTAMCLWEAWLELENQQALGKETELAIEMQRLREAHGTCSLRLMLVSAVKDCDIAWEAYEALQGDSICFDWEFVPEFLAGQVLEGRFSDDNVHQWRTVQAA